MQNIQEQEAYKELHRRQQVAMRALVTVKESLWMVAGSDEELSKKAYTHMIGSIDNAIATIKRGI